MFSKFIDLFKVKEDDTLNYINPQAFSTQRQARFSQEDEDAFFQEINIKDIDNTSKEASPKTKQERLKEPRESTLKKMYACMQQRDWNLKHHPKLFLGLMALIFLLGILAFALHETPNPLLGKWQPLKTKSNVFATGDIEFLKHEFKGNGVSTPIKYDIDDQHVEVIDLATKTRITFDIKDDKTIECTILGIKTTYKKLNK